MKKQLLLLILTMLPLVASAHDIEVQNADGKTIYYNWINNNTELEVTHGSPKYEYNVVIPEEVTYMKKKYKVTRIGEDAFFYCSRLTSITIPKSVKSIGSHAFAYCTNLKKVIVSDIAAWCGIEFDDIEANPLDYARHLYSDENTEIKNLVIPNSVTSIGNYAFIHCSSLTSVTIGSGVTSIGDYAFHSCYGLSSVTIPNSVTSIRECAFYYCEGLTSITIPNSVTSIGEFAFCGCSGLSSVTIPNSVTSIRDCAFSYCSGLTSVTIGSGVTRIGRRAFIESDIPTVISLIENPFAIYGKTSRDGIFTLNTFNNATLYVPMGSIDKYKSTNGWKDFMFIEEGIPVTYHITYYIDGTEYKSYEIEEGAEIIPEPAPTKEGYTFSGWSEIPEIMPDHDVTVTGSFSISKYKLTYVVDAVKYKSYYIEYGATITPEAEPTKVGYTFSGWSNIPETMPAHDVTVTGTFSINKYKLTYTVDGEVYKTYNVVYGTAITPEPAPTKEGYFFSGWSEIPKTMPAHDVTVTGTFSINKYKLTYTVDGEVYKTYDIEYGAPITPEVEPTKEGYTFSGWSEIPATMPAHDVTVTGTFTLDTGIEEIMSNANGDVMIFTIDGKRVDNLKKGINVIRMKDGTRRKVVVR